MRPVVVIGIGNVLLRDEGAGVHVVRALQNRLGESPGVEFVDLGSGGLSLLHVLRGRKKAILVDCARMGESPGTVRCFRPVEVRSRKVVSGLSLHEADVLKLVQLAAELGQAPEEVVIFGVQPADTSPGLALSTVLQAKLNAYVEEVAGELPATHEAAPHAALTRTRRAEGG